MQLKEQKILALYSDTSLQEVELSFVLSPSSVTSVDSLTNGFCFPEL